MGCPIRRFTDQSLFAAPHDLSQRTTSFIASQHQGIHRILLRHLITLIIDALSHATSRRSSRDDPEEVAGDRDLKEIAGSRMPPNLVQGGQRARSRDGSMRHPVKDQFASTTPENPAVKHGSTD